MQPANLTAPNHWFASCKMLFWSILPLSNPKTFSMQKLADNDLCHIVDGNCYAKASKSLSTEDGQQDNKQFLDV